MYGQATGVAGAEMNNRDPGAALSGLTTQLLGLGAVLTSPMMESAAGGLDRLARAIHGVAEAAQEHPDVAKPVAAGGIAGLIAGGSVLAGKAADAVRLWWNGGGAAAGGAAGAAGGSALGGIAAAGRAALRWGGNIGALVAIAQLLYDYGPNAIGDPNNPPKGDPLDTMRRRNRSNVDLDKMRDERDEHDRLLRMRAAERAGLPMYGPPLPLPSSPPLPPPRPPDLAMNVDVTKLDDVKVKGDAAKESLSSLNATVTPNVETSSIQSAFNLLQQVEGSLGRIGSLVRNLPSVVAPVKSLGAMRRESFSGGYTQGE